MLDIDYDVMDIDGYLEASVDMKIKVPVAISGYFKINYTDDVKNTLDQTRIKASKFFYKLKYIFFFRCILTLSLINNPQLWKKL